MVDMNSNEEKAQEILTLIGNNLRYNIHGREHTWYGLWNRVLRIFETSKKLKDCAVFPQYPVWYEMPEDGLQFDIMEDPAPKDPAPKPGPKTNKPDLDAATTSKDPEDPFGEPIFSATNGTIDPNLLLIEAMTSESDSHELTNDEKLFGNLLLGNSSPQSWIDEPIPSSPQGHGLHHDSPPDSLRTELRRAINERNQNIVRHKVTDFAILHIIWSDVHVGTRTLVKLHDIFIPVIVEVKFYRNFYQNNESREMVHSRSLQMDKAIGSLLPQIGYMFSRSKQNKVIGIAVAGSFWCWREFKKGDIQVLRQAAGNNKVEVREDGSNVWSNEARLGTEASKAEFEKVEKWVERFIYEPKGGSKIAASRTTQQS